MSQQAAGLQSELARLEDAYKKLSAKWDRIREEWPDGNAEAIEVQFLEPLGQLVRNTVPAIGQLNDELNRSVRRCSEPRDLF